MLSFILILINLVLGDTLFAQNEIHVYGQKLQLNCEERMDGMMMDSLCVAVNVKGFYGPYVINDTGGFSKEYWLNGNYSDNMPASSVFMYSGEGLNDSDLSRFGVKSSKIICQDGRKSLRGSIDGLNFREDYYGSNRLMIAYYYVRNCDVSRFDKMLDDAHMQLLSNHFYVVSFKAPHDIWIIPSSDYGHVFRYSCPTDSFLDLVSHNAKKVVSRNNRSESVYITPVTGKVYSNEQNELFYIGSCEFWSNATKTAEYKHIKRELPRLIPDNG